MYTNIQKVRMILQKLIFWAHLSNMIDSNIKILQENFSAGKKTIELENILFNFYQLEKNFLTCINLYLSHVFKLIVLISNETYIGYFSLTIKNSLSNEHYLKIINLPLNKLSPEVFDNHNFTKDNKNFINDIYKKEYETINTLFDYLYSNNITNPIREEKDYNDITCLFQKFFIKKYNTHPLIKTILFIDKGLIGNKFLLKGYNIDMKTLIFSVIKNHNPITNTIFFQDTLETIKHDHEIEFKILSSSLSTQ